jgi:hypothetical protein
VSGEDLTWEEIVNRVTIASNYSKVRESARLWHTTLTQTAELRDSLHEMSRRSESWRGGGGNAFRDHVAKLTDALDRTVQSHQRVVAGLNACAGHLETAVKKIPIPSWMYADVVRMRADYSSGALDSVKPGQFWGGLVKLIRDQVPDSSSVEAALRSGEEHMRLWLSDARAAYDELCREYAKELAGMPKGTAATVPGINSSTSGRGLPGTQQNGQKAPAAQKPPAGLGQNATPGQNVGQSMGQPGGQNVGLPPSLSQPQIPGYTATPLPGYDVDPRPSTGLESGASLGGMGLGGAGIGGGVGIGGGGGGLPAIGPAVSLPQSAMMAGTIGGGAAVAGGARVPGTGGRGTAAGPGGGASVMPMGAGHGGAGSTDRAGTETWLKEDDDYFGPDAATPDGVLDA